MQQRKQAFAPPVDDTLIDASVFRTACSHIGIGRREWTYDRTTKAMRSSANRWWKTALVEPAVKLCWFHHACVLTLASRGRTA